MKVVKTLLVAILTLVITCAIGIGVIGYSLFNGGIKMDSTVNYGEWTTVTDTDDKVVMVRDKDVTYTGFSINDKINVVW